MVAAETYLGLTGDAWAAISVVVAILAAGIATFQFSLSRRSTGPVDTKREKMLFATDACSCSSPRMRA